MVPFINRRAEWETALSGFGVEAAAFPYITSASSKTDAQQKQKYGFYQSLPVKSRKTVLISVQKTNYWTHLGDYVMFEV